jgi:hypothetical protein
MAVRKANWHGDDEDSFGYEYFVAGATKYSYSLSTAAIRSLFDFSNHFLRVLAKLGIDVG